MAPLSIPVPSPSRLDTHTVVGTVPVDADDPGGATWSGGRSLQELGATELPWPVIARIGASVAASLAERHARAEVHGDVRAETIVACADGRTWLVEPTTAARIPTTGRRRNAPELARGGTPSAASDVYQLGITLLGLLGHRTDRVRATAVGDVHGVGVPAGTEQVLMGMVAESPDARLSAAAVAGRLAAGAQDERRAEVEADDVRATDEDLARGDDVVVDLFPDGLPAPTGPRPRTLGLAVLSAVTVMYALMLTFASSQPESSVAPEPVAVAGVAAEDVAAVAED